MNKKILPNLFIVGAPRAGTTSLYEYLRTVPGVYMSPVKEPHFFAPSRYEIQRSDPNYSRTRLANSFYNNPARYFALFNRVRDEQVIGEASTSYLWDRKAPLLIHEAVPIASIIMILRNPIDRTFSDFLLHVREGRQRLSFEDAILQEYKKIEEDMKHQDKTSLRWCPHLDQSFYADAVGRYIKIFGKRSVKVLIYEEFFEDIAESFSEVTKFLALTTTSDFEFGKKHNASGKPRGKLAEWYSAIANNEGILQILYSLPSPLQSAIRKIYDSSRTRLLLDKSKPEMKEETRAFLRDLYRDDVQKLEKILGRRLPWSDFAE